MPRKYNLVTSLLLLFMLLGSAYLVFNINDVRLGRSDKPVSADLIICLNGEQRIAKAAKLYQQGWADTVLLTARKTDEKLVQKGVPSNAVKLAPRVSTTFEEALAAREYVIQHPAATVLVISDPFHLARVRWSFKKTFQGLGTRLLFVGSDLRLPRRGWYHDAKVRYQVATEVSKMIFYQTYFGILGQKSVPEWLDGFKPGYLKVLKKILS